MIMDRETQLLHLLEAENHVACGARLVAEQEARVAQLDRDGRDTTRAEQLLATFRETQAQHIEHRDLVRGEMSE